jgi:peptide deformylase
VPVDRLDIVHWPDPVLSKGTKPVEKVDEDLNAVVLEMKRIMFDLRGVGLAAPQVGVGKRMMLVCPSGEPGDETVVINPEILERTGEDEMEEGCLSFPGIYGSVVRATGVRVRYRDLAWAEKDLVLEGFVARVFQHEFDHLNGIVFVDRMTPADRMRNRARLDELKKKFAAKAIA